MLATHRTTTTCIDLAAWIANGVRMTGTASSICRIDYPPVEFWLFGTEGLRVENLFGSHASIMSQKVLTFQDPSYLRSVLTTVLAAKATLVDFVVVSTLQRNMFENNIRKRGRGKATKED